MPSIIVARRFRGPPDSANGGYVCGLLAKAMGGDAEITLRAPPPLDMPLGLVRGEGGVELFRADTLLATARPASVDVPDIPAMTFGDAEEAARHTPYDEGTHSLPGCFVCGPGRAPGDGLRIHAGPAPRCDHAKPGLFAASWIPHASLVDGGRIAQEFIWAALDCPTGYACMFAGHLGMTGDETIRLGRMSARIEERPSGGEGCVIVAWPTGREGRKLFADSALLGEDGRLLAAARTTWISLDQDMRPGGKA
jgi:hypothetical protein